VNAEIFLLWARLPGRAIRQRTLSLRLFFPPKTGSTAAAPGTNRTQLFFHLVRTPVLGHLGTPLLFSLEPAAVPFFIAIFSKRPVNLISSFNRLKFVSTSVRVLLVDVLVFGVSVPRAPSSLRGRSTPTNSDFFFAARTFPCTPPLGVVRIRDDP